MLKDRRVENYTTAKSRPYAKDPPDFRSGLVLFVFVCLMILSGAVVMP